MISVSNRRQFLTNSAILLAAVAAGSSFKRKSKPLLLSFSTLGCPDWTFQQIIDFAALHGYEGIEMRGILRQMDLTKCAEFGDIQNISATLTRLKEKNLSIVNLGSSANMHISDPVKRKENMDEAKRFIDLAQKLGCPFIRVFPNNLPKDQDKEATLQLIIEGLKELAEYAKGTSVIVLMETHGDLFIPVIWKSDAVSQSSSNRVDLGCSQYVDGYQRTAGNGLQQTQKIYSSYTY